ncbi:UDP-glucosyltransferase 2 isoform X1 [Anabrus simplex]|uniref:UDP-glucosyltransferase 2 isoform X1 n=1 Tax=Anabrus simplex TaxID=316456 RepID=UPI0035A343B1
MLLLHLLIILLCWHADAARILGIFPTASISHQLPMQAIMKALAARGHQVTVISPNPLPDPPTNYTDVDLSFSYEYFHSRFDFARLPIMTGEEFVIAVSTYAIDLCDAQLSSKPLQDFIRTNNETFDMVIYEPLTYQCYFGLYHKVGSPPLVGVLSLGSPSPTLWAIGNPDHPAFSPHWINPFSDHMTFWERMYSTSSKLWMNYYMNYEVMPAQEKVMRKHFGSAPPPVAETERNKSLLLVYNHWSLDYPRPLLPNVVQITGLHLKQSTSPLPQKIKQFIDEAKEGVIYFSMGSNVRSDRLSKTKIAAILEVFSELPQRVIWKWESDSLPGQPANVMIAKWLPQQDILAHPNIRAFIFQGGLQSLQEATYNAVPLVGIPIFSDQAYNVKYIETIGIGVKLEIDDLSKETLHEALKKVLHDPRYRNKMQQVSAVYREEVPVSLDRAIWWIEYVLRHKGAHHLRSAALDLHLYQYLLLDVIAAILLALTVVFIIAYYILKLLFSYVRRSKLVSFVKKNQ